MHFAIGGDCTCSCAGLKNYLICLTLTWLAWCLSARLFHAEAIARKMALCSDMVLIPGQDSGFGAQAEYEKI